MLSQVQHAYIVPESEVKVQFGKIVPQLQLMAGFKYHVTISGFAAFAIKGFQHIVPFTYNIGIANRTKSQHPVMHGVQLFAYHPVIVQPFTVGGTTKLGQTVLVLSVNRVKVPMERIVMHNQLLIKSQPFCKRAEGKHRSFADHSPSFNVE
jgi:hypothetical protein